MASRYTDVLTIKSVDDLRALNKDARTRRRRRVGRIAIDLQGVNPEVQRRAEQRINKAYFACGCAEATAVGLVALAASIGWLVLAEGGIGAKPWYAWLYPVAAFALGTGLGKWIGLVRARLELRRAINDLAAESGIRLQPEPAPGSEKPMCAVN